MITATKLSLSRGERVLFRDLSLEVASGEAVALTGANGAGKTSLLRAIAGFIRPDAGTIAFSAADVAEARARHLHWLGHLDGLKGAAVDGHLQTVVMETRKPPRGLAGAPGVAGLDLAAITTPTVVFEGTAREACRAFPANVNVVAAVSLAGLGADRTCIRVLADPAINRNRHTVTAEGGFGRLRIELENVPSENPRPGKLSYLSTIAYLRDLTTPLRVGT